MKIRFLGTGAADWEGTEPEYRRFSSMILDETIMLDAPDQALELLGNGLPSSILYTHSHADHYSSAALRKLARLRKEKGLPGLEVFAEKGWADSLFTEDLVLRKICAFQTIVTEGYTITALPANHVTSIKEEQPLHYLIKKQTQQILYATDGAWMLRAAVNVLQQEGPLDALIIDATIGDHHEGDFRIFEHNSLPMIRMMKETLQQTGILKRETPIILTHLARTLHPEASILEQSLQPPFVAARDGQTIWI